MENSMEEGLFVNIMLGPGRYENSPQLKVADQIKAVYGIGYKLTTDDGGNYVLWVPVENKTDAVAYITEFHKTLGRSFLVDICELDELPIYTWSVWLAKKE